MASITYIANARAPLITDSPVHAAGDSFSFDVKLRGYSSGIDQPKTQHISLGNQVESILQRATEVHVITLIWPDDENAQMQEFLYSIAGGEQFIFDPYGTVISADSPFNVVASNNAVSINRMQHGKVHWRSVTLNLRTV